MILECSCCEIRKKRLKFDAVFTMLMLNSCIKSLTQSKTLNKNIFLSKALAQTNAFIEKTVAPKIPLRYIKAKSIIKVNAIKV